MLKLKDVKDMPICTPVLAKLGIQYNDFLSWYVIEKEPVNAEHGEFRYVEASGEQYMEFEEDEIVGWVALTELDQVITK